MKLSTFLCKHNLQYKLLTMSFASFYNSSFIVLFILEQSVVLRQLFRLRHEGLYALNVESCRVAIFSGYYISFHFKTLSQLLKFLELNYLFNTFCGFILIGQTFLNCSFMQLKHDLLYNFSSMYIFKYL